MRAERAEVLFPIKGLERPPVFEGFACIAIRILAKTVTQWGRWTKIPVSLVRLMLVTSLLVTKNGPMSPKKVDDEDCDGINRAS